MALKINKINTKLQLYFFTLILLAVAIGLVYHVYVQRIKAYHQLKEQVDELLKLNPKVVQAEQNFLLNDFQNVDFMQFGESQHIEEYQKNIQKTRNFIEQIQNNPLAEKLKVNAQLQEIKVLVTKHNEVFLELIDKYKYRGAKDFGLEGKMRKAIQRLESIDTLHKAAFLTLRRYEKDFLARKDLAYVDSLKISAHNLIQVTRENIDRRHSNSLANFSKIILLVNQYVKQFERMVQIETEIGLTENAGIRGKLKQTAQKIEKDLTNIDKYIDRNTAALDESSTFVIQLFFIIILVLAVIFALVIAYRFSRPIIILDRVAQSVSQGLRNQEVFLDKIKSNDEIGSLARNFKLMLLKLKNVIQQANEKNRQLEEFTKTEARRAWFNEGLSIFNELLRKNYSDLGKLSDEVVSELVKYTKSSQGGVFVVNRETEDSQFLELKGCYAYERKRFQQKRIEYGEGLLGTAWREGHKILVKDIPDDYAHIQSSLGKAKPNALLILPIKSDEGIEGVLELISFHPYSDFEIQFIEAISERMGSSIVTIKSNEETQKLLKLSENIAQISKAKEALLQKQVAEYQHWIQEFELKVNNLSDETLIYHAILGKVYSGFVITDQQFRITKINLYAAKRFGFKRSELENRPLELFLEADYNSIIDLKEKKLRLTNRSTFEPIRSRVRDKQGNFYEVESVSGKIEIDTQIVYVFLFNELEEKNASPRATTEAGLKVAS